MVANSYYYGLGRRKTATARARLHTSGSGAITINGKSAEDYVENSQQNLNELHKPLSLLEKSKQFDISLVVVGGGTSGQIGACQLAISKALASIDDAHRGTLKKAGLLKRDSREKERKKYGLKRARKAEQYTKR